MPPQTINDYEVKIKEGIMNSFIGNQLFSLKQLLKDLILENPEDSKLINYAYINVENELIGFNKDDGNKEDICEQSNHI